MINSLLKIGNQSKNEKARNLLGRLFAISLISIILTTSAFPIATQAQETPNPFIPTNTTGNAFDPTLPGGPSSSFNSDGSLAPTVNNSNNPLTGTNPASTGQTSQSNNSGLANFKPTNNDTKCGGFSFFTEFKWCAATSMLALTGQVLYLSGVLLNKSIDLSVIRMKEMVDGMPAVGFVWTAFRDLANIFFIFVLIFIAFKTILGLDQKDTQKMLIKVIIVGLFINFSLLFTKMAIDASNIVAIQFYKSMQVGDDSGRGLSAALTDGMRLSTIYNVRDPNSLNVNNALTIGFMGSIFFLIAAFVFLAAAIMFIVRFVTLLVLMMTSPIVMALSMIPGSGPAKAVSEWFGSIIKQLIFAPVFMMMMWVVIMVVSRSRTLVPGDNGTNMNFATAMTGGGVDSIAVILNFVVVIALTISALTIAKMAGGSSYGDKVMNWGKSLGLGIAGGAVGGAIGLSGWAGRRTIGGAASNILNADENTWRGKFAKSIKDKAPTSTINRLGLNTLKGVANSSFDVRAAPLGIGKTLTKEAGGLGINIGKAQEGGFEAKMKAQKEREIQRAKDLGEGVVYNNKQTEDEVKGLMDAKKASDARIEQWNKEIAKAKSEGRSEKEIADLEDQKLIASAESSKTQKEMDAIKNNPALTRTRQEAYAETAAKGKGQTVFGALARVASVVTGGDGKTAEKVAQNIWATRGNRDAAKELTKDRAKKEQEWAQKEGAKRHDEAKKKLDEIEKMKAELDKLNSSTSTLLGPNGQPMPTTLTTAQISRRDQLVADIASASVHIPELQTKVKEFAEFAKKQKTKSIEAVIKDLTKEDEKTGGTTNPATPPPAGTPPTPPTP